MQNRQNLSVIKYAANVSKKGRRKRKVIGQPILLSEKADQFLKAAPETWTYSKSWNDRNANHLAINFLGNFYLGLTGIPTKIAPSMLSFDLFELRHSNTKEQIQRLVHRALEMRGSDRLSS